MSLEEPGPPPGPPPDEEDQKCDKFLATNLDKIEDKDVDQTMDKFLVQNSDKFLAQNSVIGVTVDDHQDGVVVVSFKHGDKLYQGALLHVNTERGLPSGLTFPQANLPVSEDNNLLSQTQETSPLKQRHTYFPDSPADYNQPTRPRVTLRRIIKPPARFKNSRMPVRFRNRPVLCLKCKAFCEEIRDKEKSKELKEPGDKLLLSSDSTNCINSTNSTSTTSTTSTTSVKIKKKKSPPPVLLGVTTRRGYAKSIELGFDDLNLNLKKKEPSPEPPVLPVSPVLHVKVSKIKNTNDKSDTKDTRDPTSDTKEPIIDESAKYERVGHLGFVDNYWKRPVADPELVLNSRKIEEKQSYNYININRTNSSSSSSSGSSSSSSSSASSSVSSSGFGFGFSQKISENSSYISQIHEDNMTKIIFKNISTQSQQNTNSTNSTNSTSTISNYNQNQNQPPKLTPSLSSCTSTSTILNVNDKINDKNEDEFYQMPKLLKLSTLPGEKVELICKNQKNHTLQLLPPQLPPVGIRHPVSNTVLIAKPVTQSQYDQARSQLKISIIKVAKPTSTSTSLKIKSEESKKILEKSPFIIKNSSLPVSNLNLNQNTTTNGHTTSSSTIENLSSSSNCPIKVPSNNAELNYSKVNWSKSRFRKGSTVPVRFRDESFATKNIFRFKSRRSEDNYNDNYNDNKDIEHNFVDVEGLDDDDVEEIDLKNDQESTTSSTISSINSVKSDNDNDNYGQEKDKLCTNSNFVKLTMPCLGPKSKSGHLNDNSPKSKSSHLNDNSSKSGHLNDNLPKSKSSHLNDNSPKSKSSHLNDNSSKSSRLTDNLNEISSIPSSINATTTATTTTKSTSGDSTSYGSVIKIAIDPKNGYVVVPNSNYNSYNNNSNSYNSSLVEELNLRALKKAKKIARKMRSTSGEMLFSDFCPSQNQNQKNEAEKSIILPANNGPEVNYIENSKDQCTSRNMIGNTLPSFQTQDGPSNSNIIYNEYSKIKINMSTPLVPGSYIDNINIGPSSTDSTSTYDTINTNSNLKRASELPSNSTTTTIFNNDDNDPEKIEKIEKIKKSQDLHEKQGGEMTFCPPKKKKKDKKRKKDKLSPNENEKSAKHHHDPSLPSDSAELKETSGVIVQDGEVRPSRKIRSSSFEHVKKSKRNSSDEDLGVGRRNSTESSSSSSSSRPVKQARMSATTTTATTTTATTTATTTLSLPSESIIVDDKNNHNQKTSGEKLCSKLLIRRLDQSSYVTCTNSSNSSNSISSSSSSTTTNSNNNVDHHIVPLTTTTSGSSQDGDSTNTTTQIIDLVDQENGQIDENEESGYPPVHSLDDSQIDYKDSIDFFTDNKNDTYKKGDIIWGKTDGCCWWPGKIVDILLIQDGDEFGCRAKISWYKSTNMSYLKFNNLARFFEEFDYKYMKKGGKRLYQAAVRDALIQAHKLNPGDLP